MRVERIGNATLYLGDARTLVSELAALTAVVTDPPYGIAFKPGTRSTKKNDVYAGGSWRTEFAPIAGDTEQFDPRPWLRKHSIFWGANNYAQHLPSSNGWLCWYKAGGIQGFRMSEAELAWTNVLTSTKHIDHMWHGFKRASQVGERVNHPTEKPVAVMAWALSFLPESLPVLDPFMGSGTTGVACAASGRPFVGVEIERTYFDIACERIAAAAAQGRLFA